MIIVRMCLSVIGNPELFISPRPWLMSVPVIRLSHPRALHCQPPPCLSEPLHFKGAVLESDPSSLLHVVALPRLHLYLKTRRTGLTVGVQHRLHDPPCSFLPQHNHFLITYQACHHYHGDDNANHNYYSY